MTELWVRSGLRFWRLWLFLWVALVLLVIYLSLGNLALPQLHSTLGDKVNHLIAYSVLMGWFGQLYVETKLRLMIAIGLVGLGVAMEFAQGMTAHRHFDWLDAGANTLGVICGLAAIVWGADKILFWVERWLR